MLLVEVAGAPGCHSLLFDWEESSLYTMKDAFPVHCQIKVFNRLWLS